MNVKAKFAQENFELIVIKFQIKQTMYWKHFRVGLFLMVIYCSTGD